MYRVQRLYRLLRLLWVGFIRIRIPCIPSDSCIDMNMKKLESDIKECKSLKELVNILNSSIREILNGDDDLEAECNYVDFMNMFNKWKDFPIFDKKIKKHPSIYSFDRDYFMFFDSVVYRFYIQER